MDDAYNLGFIITEYNTFIGHKGNGSDLELDINYCVDGVLGSCLLGSKKITNNGFPAISAAYSAKLKGIEVVSIAFGDVSSTEFQVYANILKSVASSGDNTYYEAGEDLNEVFAGIGTSMTEVPGASNATTIDIMGHSSTVGSKYVTNIVPGTVSVHMVNLETGIEEDVDNDVVKVDASTKSDDGYDQIKWEILGDLDENYKYVLSYNVQINPLDVTGMIGQFTTNESATMTFVNSEDESDTVVFDVPTLNYATYTKQYYINGVLIEDGNFAPEVVVFGYDEEAEFTVVDPKANEIVVDEVTYYFDSDATPVGETVTVIAEPEIIKYYFESVDPEEKVVFVLYYKDEVTVENYIDGSLFPVIEGTPFEVTDDIIGLCSKDDKYKVMLEGYTGEQYNININDLDLSEFYQEYPEYEGILEDVIVILYTKPAGQKVPETGVYSNYYIFATIVLMAGYVVVKTSRKRTTQN